MMSVRMQFEHVVIPGAVIDEKTVIDKVTTIAIVHLGPHPISQAHLLLA